MHTDPGSARAEVFFPLLLDAARTEAARENADPRLRRAASLLGEWKGSYGPDDERAILFELAMRELPFRIWDELIPIDEPDGRPVHATAAAGSGARRTAARRSASTSTAGSTVSTPSSENVRSTTVTSPNELPVCRR